MDNTEPDMSTLFEYGVDVQRIARLELFRELPEQWLAEVAPWVRPVALTRGSLFGDAGQLLMPAYVVSEGSVELPPDPSGPGCVGTAMPGDLLGLGMLNGPSLGRAPLRALTDTVLFEIGARRILHLCEGVPAFRDRLSEMLEHGPSGDRAAPWTPERVGAPGRVEIRLRGPAAREGALTAVQALKSILRPQVRCVTDGDATVKIALPDVDAEDLRRIAPRLLEAVRDTLVSEQLVASAEMRLGHQELEVYRERIAPGSGTPPLLQRWLSLTSHLL